MTIAANPDPEFRLASPSLPEADAYVFDIDGTLLVTEDLVHWNALHQAMLEAYGVDTTIEGIPYHGKTDPGILRAALERAGVGGPQFRAGLTKALEVVSREVDRNCRHISPRICPAVDRLLRSLRARDKLLGIASGNLESVGWHKIEAAGLRHFFAFGSFSDHRESRQEIFRHALEYVRGRLGPAARACFVGDTPSDVRAAKHVGSPILAVASGTFNVGELSACAPDVCVSHCGELFPD